MNSVEIKDKVLLTISEAALYSNIGQNTLAELINRPRCNFVLYVGNKRLIKRKEFEKYLSDTIEIESIVQIRNHQKSK